MEKVHDRGGRINNKAEKNVKSWLKDGKPGGMINGSGLGVGEESGRMRLPESGPGPAPLNCKCSRT